MVAAALEQEKYADLHMHIEGNTWIPTILRAYKRALQSLGIESSEFDDLFVFAEQSWEKAQIGTLQAFIDRLATLWIRYGMISIYTLGSEHGCSVDQIKFAITEYFGEIIDATTRMAIDQHVHGINLLVSPANMGIDGDLSLESFKQMMDRRFSKQKQAGVDYLQKELELCTRFEIARQKYAEQDETPFLTMNDYITCIYKQTEQFGVWKESNLVVLRTFSFRRDQDIKFITGIYVDRTVAWLERLFSEGVIDLVDICGIETCDAYLLEQFVPFLKKLEAKGIPYTLHFLEIPVSDKTDEETQNYNRIAIQNAMSLVGHQLKPVAVAHAARLGDQDSIMNKVLQYMMQADIALILCLSSNGATNTDSSTFHPLLQLLHNKPELQNLIGFGTDDATVTSALESFDHLRIELELSAQQLERMKTDKGKKINPEEVENMRRMLVLHSWHLFFKLIHTIDDARIHKHDPLVLKR